MIHAARIVILCVLLAPPGATLTAQDVPEAGVRAVLGLLPPEARAGARVMVGGGTEFEEVRSGGNGWTCWVERIGERVGGNCHHSVLEGLLLRKRQIAREEGEDSRATLAGEYRAGFLAIPSGSIEVTGYGVAAADGSPPDTLSGYYFIYYPFATVEDLGLPGQEVAEGAPWLHKGGTVEAHIMWPHAMEVADR